MVVSSTSEKISLIQVWLDSSNKFCFSWSPASIIRSGVTVESAGEIKMIILSFIIKYLGDVLAVLRIRKETSHILLKPDLPGEVPHKKDTNTE